MAVRCGDPGHARAARRLGPRVRRRSRRRALPRPPGRDQRVAGALHLAAAHRRGRAAPGPGRLLFHPWRLPLHRQARVPAPLCRKLEFDSDFCPPGSDPVHPSLLEQTRDAERAPAGPTAGCSTCCTTTSAPRTWCTTSTTASPTTTPSRPPPRCAASAPPPSPAPPPRRWPCRGSAGSRAACVLSLILAHRA